MAGPSEKPGVVNKRFGKTGKPVKVSAKSAAAAKAGKGRLYEDGSFVAKPAKKSTAKKRTSNR